MKQKDGQIVKLLTTAKKVTFFSCVTAFSMGALLVPAFAQRDEELKGYEQMGEATGFIIIAGVIFGLVFLVRRWRRR